MCTDDGVCAGGGSVSGGCFCGSGSGICCGGGYGVAVVLVEVRGCKMVRDVMVMVVVMDGKRWVWWW